MSEAQLKKVEQEVEKLKQEVELTKNIISTSEACKDLIEYCNKTDEPLTGDGSNPWVVQKGGGGGCLVL
eukprot:CAMPEP_0177650466 /NCGR_PEP_ID=MMETSP0447-20121125/11959_1 /TAXON_ID=0 /ORGANISM="Stygamoeba regulata, Strain BSH-02190019" /LENGTH=68 /DNA_ID=CAMNT_0019153341 /DNA_START=59 /DNA_END=265 /DNA_ORIENTATION=-